MFTTTETSLTELEWIHFAAPNGQDGMGKPTESYATMITTALRSVENHRMTLADVYVWVQSHYPYYNDETTGWKNSIRHNLSINRTFEKMARPEGDLGKGCYWLLNEAAAFDGLGISRRKRRRADRSGGSGKKGGGSGKRGGKAAAAARSPSRSCSGGRTSVTSPSVAHTMAMLQMSGDTSSEMPAHLGNPAALLAAGAAYSSSGNFSGGGNTAVFPNSASAIYSSGGYSAAPAGRSPSPPRDAALPVHVKAERRPSADCEVPFSATLCGEGLEVCFTGEMLSIACSDDDDDQLSPNFERCLDDDFDMVVPQDWIV